ncbi:MAG: phytoene/squalene synthase family protein [Polyangiaceae bacterium]
MTSDTALVAPLARERESDAVCRDTLANGSKSFALAARLLPVQMRRDAATLYTFCRRVDDSVDLAAPGTAQQALRPIQARVASIYRREAQSDPIWAAFAELVWRRRLPQLYVDELLAGMQMDVDETRYFTESELLLYCHRVAGVVGLMMCHVLGVSGNSALRNAAHLGIALQLTNIARDVEEDWNRGRLYLPNELLQRHGVHGLDPTRREPLTPSEASLLAPVLRELLELAERFYVSGDQGLPALPARARFAVRTARLVYAQIGRRLLARGCNVLAGRSVVPTHQKLLLLGRALWRSFGEWLRFGASTRAHVPSRVLAYPTDVLTPP